MESRFIGSGTEQVIGAALGVRIPLMWGVGIGSRGKVIGFKVGRTTNGRGLETAAHVVSTADLDACWTA